MIRAVGLTRRPDDLNKTEGRYFDKLLLAKSEGRIHDFKFHELTFKLGPDCRYTPEAWVLLPSGEMQLHEVKGMFVRDDAMVKLRAASKQFPMFRWFFCQEQKDKMWKIKEVCP